MRLYYYFSVNDRFFTEGTKKIKKKHDHVEFSGLAGGRRDFLDLNSDLFNFITYLSELDINNDIDFDYLRGVEEKYQIRIADLINAERTFHRLSKLDRLKYAQSIIKQVELDYEKWTFDIIFSEGIDDLPSYFLQAFAVHHNIPFYYFVYSRMGGSVFLSDRKDTGPIDFEELFEDNLQLSKDNNSSIDATKQFVDAYIRNKKQPSYVTQTQMLYRVFAFEDIGRLIRSFKNFFRDRNAYHAPGNPLFFPLQRLKKISRKKAYQKYFEKKFVKLTELKESKYFIYPLHFHPEAATLIQGRWINDQKAIIEMVSKALPADVILVVKEHTVSIGRREINFYKEIDQLHNVCFVSEKTEVYELLNSSSGVVTISSSMGLEAIMLNKPVITFGDIHYNILSQVIKARDISKMDEYVDRALSFNFYNEEEYWAFFKTITENCYELPGYSPHKFSDEHINTFVNMVEDII